MNKQIIRLTIEVELEQGVINENPDEEEVLWLENEVLVGDGNLILHSNDIGDTVGTIKKVKNITWINKTEALNGQ